jgi:hypothetical protein
MDQNKNHEILPSFIKSIDSPKSDIIESLFPNKDYEKYDKENFKKDCPNDIYQPIILPSQKRIIVIGDLHGDYNLTIDSLKVAGVIDDKLNWTGKDTVIVQVGDQVDRCRPFDHKCDHPDATLNDEASDIKIMELFNKLNVKAKKDGGSIYSLLGNHELMNSLGNLNYVSYEGLREFDNYKDPKTGEVFKDGKEGRKHAFKPGHELAKMMGCTRVPSVIIGSFIFVHAGIVPKFLDVANIKSRKDLYKLNFAIRKWLLGLINKDYVKNIVNSLKFSMFWDRILGSIPPNLSNDNDKCVDYLYPVLKIFKVKSMVVGHTPQFFNNKEGINETCNGGLWRVDTGGSDAFTKFDKEYSKNGSIMNLRQAQVLEIINDKTINILK